VIQSFKSPYGGRSPSPGLSVATPVPDQQFTLVKGLAEKLNVFSWMDAPDQKI